MQRRLLGFEQLEERTLLTIAALHLEPVTSELNSPVVATHAGDGSGRLFIAEQGGLVRIVRDGGVHPLSFLDLSSDIVTGGERGLLGLAFHPNYANAGAVGEGKFYVYYSAPATLGGNHDSVIAEYQVSASNPDVADGSSERLLLRFNQPFSNHNAGDLKFGPDDGLLYISSGDGGSGGDPQGNAQNLNNLLGAILRIDVDGGDQFPDDDNRNYAIPPSNPFVGDPNARDEIFAFGLRNPFRMSFDDGPAGSSEPARLFLGDVGQNTFEEVDIITSGGNYGWNICEANHVFNDFTQPCPADFMPPIAEYGRDVGISVIGGFVYRGGLFPSLIGRYIFGDLNGTVMVLEEQESGFVRSQPSITGLQPSAIIGFGEDESGELYVLTFSDLLVIKAHELDFGDAPDSYGTTAESNGARHIAVGPTLGTRRDTEGNAQDPLEGKSDGDDEDGMTLIATLVALPNSASTSSFSIHASQPAQLDAWIDFDQNGQFDHPGEHFSGGTSTTLSAGLNVLQLSVPAGTTSGQTFARFRLSSAGNLLPTGLASDGEVEDYTVTIHGDTTEGLDINAVAPLPGEYTLLADGADSVVRLGSIDIFRLPQQVIASITFSGTTGDDTLVLTSPIRTSTPLIRLDAGPGTDTLRLTGDAQTLDLTATADSDIQAIEAIDLADGDHELTLDVHEVLNASPTSDVILVRSNPGDVVSIGDGWILADTAVENGEFVRILTQQGATLKMVGPFHWSNPASRLDVNASGDVEPVDVLHIINELNGRQFSGADGRLADPTTIPEFPALFYDASPDGFLFPIDALVIINFINRMAGLAEGESLAPQRQNGEWLPHLSRAATPLHTAGLSGKSSEAGSFIRQPLSDREPLVYALVDIPEDDPDLLGTAVGPRRTDDRRLEAMDQALEEIQSWDQWPLKYCASSHPQ